MAWCFILRGAALAVPLDKSSGAQLLTPPRSSGGGPPEDLGGVAQLGERLLCKQEVIGSIPFTSTTDRTTQSVVRVDRGSGCAPELLSRGTARAAWCRTGHRATIGRSNVLRRAYGLEAIFDL